MTDNIKFEDPTICDIVEHLLTTGTRKNLIIADKINELNTRCNKFESDLVDSEIQLNELKTFICTTSRTRPSVMVNQLEQKAESFEGGS